MKEERAREITAKTDIAGIAIAIVGITLGLWQYNRANTNNIEFEQKKQLLQSKHDLYYSLCNNVGAMLASAGDSSAFREERKKFETYYYGQMVLVTDTAVEKQLVELKSFIEIYDPTDTNMPVKLKKKAENLKEACKASLAKAE